MFKRLTSVSSSAVSCGDSLISFSLQFFFHVFFPPLTPPSPPASLHLCVLLSSLICLIGEADLRAEEFLHCGWSESEH